MYVSYKLATHILYDALIFFSIRTILCLAYHHLEHLNKQTKKEKSTRHN